MRKFSNRLLISEIPSRDFFGLFFQTNFNNQEEVRGLCKSKKCLRSISKVRMKVTHCHAIDLAWEKHPLAPHSIDKLFLSAEKATEIQEN